jgi:cytochrome c556
MRIAMFAAAGAVTLLAACGGPETSQANNAQANLSDEGRPDPTANATATNAMVLLTAKPVTGPQAKTIMHERHEGMESIGKATKALKRELDKGSPDLAAVRTSAAQIANLAQKSSGWFPAGTGPDIGKTGAKPEIWQNPQDFAAKLAAFQKAALAFNAAAKGNDTAAIKARFGELGQTCKACHDKYRAEMHH